jgi:hypothetical protein
MATFLTAAQMALVAGFALAASPADACESNYPWTCKPVPSIEPAETTEPAANAKPLQINARRRAATSKTKEANERATRKPEKRAAHKAAARRYVTRARQARAERTADAARAEEVEVAPAMPRRRPAAAGPRPVDAGAESNSGFMAAWMERTGTPAEPARPAPVVTASAISAPAITTSAVTVAAAGPAVGPVVQVSQPAPAPAVPVRVAAQNEVNELDLVAAETSAAPAESSWLRSLFLAFGGLIAVGSALRLFL